MQCLNFNLTEYNVEKYRSKREEISESSRGSYLATIFTCQKVSIWKTNQNLKSDDDNHLSITNSNRACFAKLGHCGFKKVMF